jgi:uncharacterized protein
MPKQLYVNVAIKDIARSVSFFTALGFSFNPKFTDENATCLMISDEINVMLLTEPFFKGFISKQLADTQTHSEVILALSVDTREAVDAMVEKAKSVGATTPMPPKDYGFMYQHGFEDLDGHLWEVFYMDPNHAC